MPVAKQVDEETKSKRQQRKDAFSCRLVAALAGAGGEAKDGKNKNTSKMLIAKKILS